MRHSLKRFLAALALVLAATSLAAGPVGASPAPYYGVVVNCRYHATSMGPYGWATARLKRFVVTPPEMFANSGQQQVGWLFLVQRSLNRQNGPWETTYTSPIQKRVATTTQAAPFEPMSVGVTIPTVENRDDIWYHVTVKMFRYRPDGSLKSKVSFLMPFMEWVVDGQWSDTEDWCPAIARQVP